MRKNHEENRLWLTITVILLLYLLTSLGSVNTSGNDENSDLVHVWSVDLDGSPFLAPYPGEQGTLYVADAYYQRLHLLNEDGSILWTTNVSRYISSMIDADGTFYFLTYDDETNHSYLDCMDINGLRWRSSYETVFSFPSSILQIHEGYLYLCTEGGIIEVLDDQGNTVSTIDTGLSAVQCMGVDENTILIYDGNNIYGLDHQGSLKWDYALPEGASISESVLDEQVYLRLMIRDPAEWGDTFLPTTESVFLVLDEDGTFLWNYTFDDDEISAGFVLGDQGEVYASSVDGISVRVFCLDRHGNLIWEHTYEGADRPLRPLIAGNNIYVAVYRYDTVKELLIFDMNGEMIGYRTGEFKLSSHPAVVNGNIYFSSSNGVLHRFEVPGEEKKVNDRIPGFPIMTLLFCTPSVAYIYYCRKKKSTNR